MARGLAEVLEQAKLKAYHGSPYKFDEFSDDAIGTGEGAQAYGYGHYFAEREGTAISYRDSNTKRNSDYENYLMDEYKRAESRQNYGRMEMLEQAMLHETPDDFRKLAKDTDYDDDYRQAAARMADEIEAFRDSDGKPVNFGSMYEVEIDAADDELLDFDAPVNQQPRVMRAFRAEIIDQEADSPGEMTGMDLLRELGSNRAASKALNEAGFKGIKYTDAQTRFSSGKKTKNYVIFDPRLIEISRRYGIPITAAATMLQQQDVRAEEIPNMQAVEQRAQAFANQRDTKNKAWSNLKDAVGKMTQPFQPLAEFVAHSAAGMGSGLVGAVGYSETDIPAQSIEQSRDMVRGIPEQMGFGPMDENAYQIALNQAIDGISDTIMNDNAMRAFVDPVMQDVAPQLMNQYQQLDPRTQGMLSGLGEYIGNAIR